MRDIPVFTTENGVATLILKQIPCRGEAYIRILDSLSPEALLKQCVEFCVAVGAKYIYAQGHACLEKYPLHTRLLRLQRPREGLPETDAALFPVQEHTFERWRQIYNEKMADVPGAAALTFLDKKEILASGSAYFVHRGDTLLGIGKVSGGVIEALASTVKGAGTDVLLALCHALTEDTVNLQVADNNLPAMRLYDKLGFLPVEVVGQWYRVG